MGQATYSIEEILTQLDDGARHFSPFPMLDNGYIYPADVRLSAYRDDRRWAILIETLGFSYKLGLPEGIRIDIGAFGNCLVRPFNDVYPLTWDPVEIAPDASICDVPPEVTEVRIRGEAVPIPRDRAVSTAKGIDGVDPERLQGHQLLRVLLPEHREALLATEGELRQRLPADLPLFLRLDEWHHPDLVEDERPSETSTFQKLAEAMVLGDPNRFLMTEPPNTHWKHWPYGGAC